MHSFRNARGGSCTPAEGILPRKTAGFVVFMISFFYIARNSIECPVDFRHVLLPAGHGSGSGRPEAQIENPSCT